MILSFNLYSKVRWGVRVKANQLGAQGPPASSQTTFQLELYMISWV